ncbi:sulfite oxidase [Roseospira visakhapatnamensis]|uniref:DMSO/TMAO reductase YedYZ molybdopterin-dependent catalytic subunit n=1 Tax=Roseospira visakhapatnamensis TaxID=390880 RepID=A0A7W6W8R9_9PROT|nr:sulfite oxidase [Roseospira visakhapatnamensis]MBB4265159.1 DMSO/TMAO reductase YedYZ molybdopterin-dependent catalytic subunit [Roseospira visakhapatnamensis]
MPKDRGLRELYEQDPIVADEIVFGRRTGPDRRGFLKGAGLAAMGTVLGAGIPFHRSMPAGLIPAALADSTDDVVIEGKTGLRVLNDRPVNAETPAHLLDDDVTPVAHYYIRNNGVPPDNTRAEGWRLTVDGEVHQALNLTIGDLADRFEVVTLRLQHECGGNGRAGFNPPASGNQWTTGAIGNAAWTGVRMRDVLDAAGLKDSALYTAHHGADTHLSGDPAKVPISRGVPMWKAMDPHTLIAWQMNGQDIHPMNGAPLRILCPGWPGSTSQKWLTRIQVRDVVHDGTKMTAPSYSVPYHSVQPGAEVAKADFKIIESMPVKSLITYPRSGMTLPEGHRALRLRGHAWSGDDTVTAVDVSHDFGATWTRATLSAPPNPYSWQRWEAELSFPTRGYYEIWARATNGRGRQQPFIPPWNPKGYLNNAMHRIAVMVAA